MNLIDDFNAQFREMEKRALLDRLVRLGATDVGDLPGIGKYIGATPRLTMRKRSPAELAALEKGVSRVFRKVEAPLERKLHRATRNLPSGLKKIVRKGIKTLIRNPEQVPLAALPVPGVGAATLLGKGLFEKGIDRFAPAMVPI